MMRASRRKQRLTETGAMASLDLEPPGSSVPVHLCHVNGSFEERWGLLRLRLRRKARSNRRNGVHIRVLKTVTVTVTSCIVLAAFSHSLAANAFVPLSLQSSHRSLYTRTSMYRPLFHLSSVTSTSSSHGHDSDLDSLSSAVEANKEQEQEQELASDSDPLLPLVPFGANNESTQSPTPPVRSRRSIAEIDVLYGSRTVLVYDPVSERYIPSLHPDADDHAEERKSDWKLIQGWRKRILPGLRHSFLPEGVYPSYYRFIRWRILQRFINANVHVFGTQSLLMGLGLKSHSLGLSAALNWVLKDALGKIVRMAWASKMGQKFDSDAKRWRFRSSLVFALGNALEIVTYIFPSLFLLWATLANCCKQTSMLTSSSTRTAIYNSFRDGNRENIGDITAKGEAQIAVVDLLGIASGVTLSKMVGMSVRSVLGVYTLLQMMELICLYHEIRAVEFRVLNFERLSQLVTIFIREGPQAQGKQQQQQQQPSVVLLPTPQEMARTEKIFLPPQHLTRRAIAFGSMGRAKLAPDELEQLLVIFQKEKFLLVVGPNVKNRRRRRGLFLLSSLSSHRHKHPEDQCHIVLHIDATNVDIVKSTLALSLLRQALKQNTSSTAGENELRSRDCMDVIESCYQEANRTFPFLLRSMSVAGWSSPARFMFGRVKMRADWPLSTREKTTT